MRWLLLAALVAVAPAAARAQFYDLDGAYRCVTSPKEACDKAGTAPKPDAPAPFAQQKAKPAPTLGDAIERVKRRAATPADIALVEARAQAQDPRAIEVLAWCKLNGIGMPADPMAAYLLYGDAARLGVPKAKENQSAIYETRLTALERQQVLLKEDAR